MIHKTWPMRCLFLLLTVFFVVGVQGQSVRILTYNIHHANPPSKPDVIDIQAIADVINQADADVVGIQEVDIEVSRSQMMNQAEKLAELTGMNYYFSKGIDLEKGLYGVLMLSKHKIVGKRRYDLPMPVASENRSLAIIDVELPAGQVISVANTHLDLKQANRLEQVQYINELADLYKRPFILMGDLNAKPDSEEIQILEKHFVRHTQNPRPTSPNVGPKNEIDYIMLLNNSAFNWKSYEVISEANTASDHLPVLAEIEFN